MNFTTTHIRSEKVTIDTRIYTILNGRKKPGEVYLAAIAPDMELTIITLDEAPGILPCFEEDDACLNLPNTSLLLCYNPAQVLKMGGKHYLTGPVILVRTNMDGEVIPLTIMMNGACTKDMWERIMEVNAEPGEEVEKGVHE